MAIYVDKLSIQLEHNEIARHVGSRHNHQWCHLWADSLDELLKFASLIGLKEKWLQNPRLPHFDLVPSKRAFAIANGAKEMNFRDWYKNRCHGVAQ